MTDGDGRYFYHFIRRSSFASERERRLLAADIRACLAKKRGRLPARRGRDLALWRDALGVILFSGGGADVPLAGMPLCGLETEITCEILEFVEKTDAAYAEDESLAPERALIDECRELSAAAFAEYWEGFRSYIESCYAKRDLDAAFFGDIITKTIYINNEHTETAGGGEARAAALINIKELFTEKWAALAGRKARRAKKAYIVESAAPFSRLLRQKAGDLRRALAVFGVSSADKRKIYNAARARPARSRADVLEQARSFYEGDAALRRLAARLGRRRRGETARKGPPPLSRPAGVEYGGLAAGDSLADMPGAEAALMTDEDCALLFYVRFAEKRLLNYEKKTVYIRYRPPGADERREGPFILCVDTSGSMLGAPERVAKSLCFALLKLALTEKRRCRLISFAIDTAEMELTDLADNLDALCAFLGENFRGGTDITPALLRALDLLETPEYRDADVVAVSDFIMPRLDAETLERVRRRKEAGAEFSGVFIGPRRAANPALAALFDRQLFYET